MYAWRHPNVQWRSPIHLDGVSCSVESPWSRGDTYGDICQQYLRYISKHSKTVSYLCRCNCSGFMFHGVQRKRDDFLSNKKNKHRFITLLQDYLQRQGCHTEQATADLLIVQTGIAASENVSKPTILVGDDTDLLVLLCFHTKSTSRNIYFRPEPKQYNCRGNLQAPVFKDKTLQ